MKAKLLIGILFLLTFSASAAHANDILITSDTIISASDNTYEGKDIVIDNATVTIDGIHSFNKLSLINNAVLTTPEASANFTQAPELTLVTLNIDKTSSIDITGKGNLPNADVMVYSGGGYAATGGTYYIGGVLNATYGSYLQPIDFGMGGRGSSGVINRGGGAIIIKADEINLAGKILANGHTSYNSGTGSGGSLWLQVGTLRGTDVSASIQANGGNKLNLYTGTGSGGRIAIYYDVIDNFDPFTQVKASGGMTNYPRGGGAGTIYIKDLTQNHASLRLENTGLTKENASSNELGNLTNVDSLSLINANVLLTTSSIDQISMNNSHVTQLSHLSIKQMTLSTNSYWQQQGQDLEITGSYSFNKSQFEYSANWSRPEGNDLIIDDYELILTSSQTFGDLQLINGAILTTPEVSESFVQAPVLTANILSIDIDSKIDISAKGYLPSAEVQNSCGGSYGGKGGTRSGYTTNEPYGNDQQPVDFGMGGGGHNNQDANRGGGAIKIIAKELNLSGQILANGDSYVWGSGSGGSLWLEVGTLRDTSGSSLARIQTNSGSASDYGVSGSGGRIAIYYTELDGFQIAAPQITANAEQGGSEEEMGKNGTVYSRYIPKNAAVYDTSAKAHINSQQVPLTVTFINVIDPATFDVQDILLESQTQQVVNVASIDQLSPLRYQLNLASPLTDGVWQLTIGPQITSVDGYGMDQDYDGIAYEPVEDKFVSTFTVDTLPPSPATLTTHLANESYNQTTDQLTISGTRDANTRVFLNGVEQVALGTGDWTITDYTLTEGNNNIVITLVDEADNISASTEVQIIVDLTAPAVQQISPVGMINLSPDEIRIDIDEMNQVNASNSYIRLLKDSQEVINGGVLTNKKLTLALPAGLNTGRYDIEVNLEDQHGNQSSQSYSFYLLPQFPYQDIIHVGTGHPYQNIQTAIDAANEGDLILIEEGTYIESLSITKLVHLRGNTSHPSQVVLIGTYPQEGTVHIDGSGIVNSKEIPIIIENLTIQGTNYYMTSGHMPLAIENSEYPLALSKVILEPSAVASGNLIKGPRYNNLSGVATEPFMLINSRLKLFGPGHFLFFNNDKTYLLKSEAYAELSYTNSPQTVLMADYIYITHYVPDYGPEYGTDFLSTDKTNYIVKSVIMDDSITLYFSTPIRAGTFWIDDVTLTGSLAPDISQVQVISGSIFTLLLSAPFQDGIYDLTVGPDIENIYDQLMDQNQNQTTAEVADQYHINFHADSQTPAPVSLNATALSNGTEVELDWSNYDEIANGGDIDHYAIYQSVNDFNQITDASLLTTIPAGQQNTLLKNLNRDTSYYFAVVAVDHVNNLDPQVSAINVTTVDSEAPVLTASLHVDSYADQLAISWQYIDPPSDLYQYELSVDGVSVQLLNKNVNSQLVTSLQPATAYTLTLVAIDESGNRSQAITQQATTLLDNPGGLSAIAANGRATLSWDASSEPQLVQYYAVYSSKTDFTDVSNMSPAAMVTGNNTTLSLSGLNNNQTYYFAVTVINLSGGQKPGVTTIDATPVIDNSAPLISELQYDAQPITNGSVLSQSSELSVIASDSLGLSRAQFYLDGQLLFSDVNIADGLSTYLDTTSISVGSHTIKVEVFDVINNVSSLSITVQVVLAAPPAPVISSSLSGQTINLNQAEVKLQSQANNEVQFLLDGQAVTQWLTVNNLGQIAQTLTLHNGANNITALARNQGGISSSSNTVSIMVDLDIPQTPQGLTAHARPSGVIRLSWQALTDKTIVGYNLYRHNASFTTKGQATLVNTALITDSILDDIPANDGQYYYRVTAVNQQGGESALSQIASASADNTPPQALQIEYLSSGLVDQASGRMAAGTVTVKLHLSEAVLTTPFLSITPNNGMPVIISLSPVSELLYEGQFDITSNTPSGTAYAVFSARDELGNRGTDILQGNTLQIDTQGPVVTSLSVTPAEPIDNTNGATIDVSFSVDEKLASHTPPELQYLLSGNGRNALSITNLSALDDTHYQASFVLPADAGQNTPETFHFILNAYDDLHNPSEQFDVTNQFQVYQGSLPPLGIPQNFRATALPEGKIQLQWDLVNGASEYQIYRQAPGETQLTALHRSSADSLIDATSQDGEHHYAITSIRQANAQEAQSAQSQPVSLFSDSIPPAAPDKLTLELIPQGIKGQWQAISEADVSYRVYRSLNSISDISGLTAVEQQLKTTEFIDAQPSTTEHHYVVTAVDPVGNESLPSNNAYENFGLLPVSNLSIVQQGSQPPLISWTHQGADIEGYELALINQQVLHPLHNGLLTPTSYTDTGYNNDTRHYRIVAVDTQGHRSLSRDLILPEVDIEVLPGTANTHLKRGIMNSVMFRVDNLSQTDITGLRLQVDIAGKTHHSAQAWSIPADSHALIPVVIGGYDTLNDTETMTLKLISRPDVGEQITLIRQQSVTVGDAAIILELQLDNMNKGAQGDVSFIVENTSDVELEILLARDNNQHSSDEVSIRLLDSDDNILAVAPFKQTNGNQVVTLSNGQTVLRIPPHARVQSAASGINIPDAAPDEVNIELDISTLHYHLGKPDSVAIKGITGDHNAHLQLTPYEGTVDMIDPPIFRDNAGAHDIVITGFAINRSTGQPQPNVPLSLHIMNNGFTRTITLIADPQGAFRYHFEPLPTESGDYSVSVVHPSRYTRPVRGTFSIQRLEYSPSELSLSVPRHYQYTIPLVINAGQAGESHNLHLEYRAGDQVGAVHAAGVTLDLPAAIDLKQGETASLDVNFQADDSASEMGTLVLRLMSDEYAGHSIGRVTINYQLSEAQPALYATPNYLETGISQEQQSTETITLENRGQLPLRDVNLSLLDEYGNPSTESWLAIITPQEPGDLAVGEHKEVRLQLQPDQTVPDGLYRFKLQVQSSNHPPREINIYISVTQSGLGNVLFKFSDIYTGVSPGNGQAPIQGLQDVSIKLQNELVPDLSYELTSDSLGEAWFSDLKAGYYRYRASASRHEQTTGRIIIKPGVTLSENVFMPYNLINILWSVNEIPLEDKYEITLHAVYEVDVPTAVIVAEPASVTLPEMAVGEVYHGEFTLTNYGLIRADDLQIHLPKNSEYFKYELMPGLPDHLDAKERITVAYRAIALKPLDANNNGNASGGGCGYTIDCFHTMAVTICVNGKLKKIKVPYCVILSYSDCPGLGGGASGPGYYGYTGPGWSSSPNYNSTPLFGKPCIPAVPGPGPSPHLPGSGQGYGNGSGSGSGSGSGFDPGSGFPPPPKDPEDPEDPCPPSGGGSA